MCAWAFPKQRRSERKQFVIGMYLKLVMFAFALLEASSQQFIPRQSPCPSVEFINRTFDGWHGNLVVVPTSDVKGVQIEVTFDDFVPAFVNNFAHSSSKDNEVFTIVDKERSLKRGQQTRIGFFAKATNRFRIPLVTSFSFNGAQICPHDQLLNEDTTCAKFEMIGNGTGGRWDGVLTVYPKVPRNGIRVDLQFDEKAWALGNDLGDTRTFDQKRFIIFGPRHVRPGTRLPINFFVKYDELEQIPQLRNVFVDGVSTCISGLSKRPARFEPMGGFTTEAPKTDGISLADLPFQSNPSVTLIPQQVKNNGFDCGLSGNGLQNRFSGGAEAEVGQFPFHVAVFRDLIYICGASLISQRTVITAGHCVVNDNKQSLPKDSFRLLFGAVDLRSLSGSESLREVSEIVTHPDYDYDKIIKQDIALMMIQGNLQFTPTISPICLYDFQTPITNQVNQSFIVLGFGSNENTKQPSRFLNFGQMSIITRQQCIESKLIFGLLPEQSAFCAKAVDSMIACPGDSGGGLIFIENGKYFLRGISSVTITDSNGKCDSTQSVAFTDVSFFLPWIRQSNFDVNRSI